MKKTIASRLFATSSVTYFNASKLFPAQVRRDVTILYGFVRMADNFVDQKTGDHKGLSEFIAETKVSLETGKGTGIIGDFVNLCQKVGIELSWVEAFLESMESDLTHTAFVNQSQTMEYMYGSAEVIGLMMARVLRLPSKADPFARLLGRSMQYANFLRDIGEDEGLGRQYFAMSLLNRYGLNSLSKTEAHKKPEVFTAFFKDQVRVYHQWRNSAHEGFYYIPRSSVVPIATSDAMYAWTLDTLAANPLRVFETQLKPPASLVIMTGITYKLRSWLPF